MSWIESLYRTYELNYGNELGNLKLNPIFHVKQNAHICVAVDIDGNFRSARVITDKNEKEKTIPATEKSSSRTSGIAPHPLFDKLMYVAGDFPEKRSGFKEYMEQLNDWCASEYSHPKVRAVRIYLEKERLIRDLIEHKILPVDEDGELLIKKPPNLEQNEVPAIFGVVPSDPTTALVVFECHKFDDPEAKLWEDKSVQKSWIDYRSKQLARGSDTDAFGLCYVSGEEASLCASHPRRICHSGDGAKLISSNDTTNFTFRGKFEDASQACGVSSEITQKAHNALSWLFEIQGWHDDSQYVVAWAIAKDVSAPSPVCDTGEFTFGNIESENGSGMPGTAEESAKALGMKIDGYRSKLNATDMAVLMIEPATPGTMAIKYYRELPGSEFLDHLEHWHTNCAWMQFFGKNKQFYGAASPREITKVIYGSNCDAKLMKSTVARLLPCIMEGKPLPRDIVIGAVRSASNPNALNSSQKWEFSRNLGVACSLYKYSKPEEKYSMALEEDRKTRGYLYGRLLAVADYLESSALQVTAENRDTNAMRLMQRFSDRPYSTWRNLALKLEPYKSRLRANKPGTLVFLESILSEIHSKFEYEDFCSEKPLDGEYLLGFYCQRNKFYTSKKDSTNDQSITNEEEN